MLISYVLFINYFYQRWFSPFSWALHLSSSPVGLQEQGQHCISVAMKAMTTTHPAIQAQVLLPGALDLRDAAPEFIFLPAS